MLVSVVCVVLALWGWRSWDLARTSGFTSSAITLYLLYPIAFPVIAVGVGRGLETPPLVRLAIEGLWAATLLIPLFLLDAVSSRSLDRTHRPGPAWVRATWLLAAGTGLCAPVIWLLHAPVLPFAAVSGALVILALVGSAAAMPPVPDEDEDPTGGIPARVRMREHSEP